MNLIEMMYNARYLIRTQSIKEAENWLRGVGVNEDIIEAVIDSISEDGTTFIKGNGDEFDIVEMEESFGRRPNNIR